MATLILDSSVTLSLAFEDEFDAFSVRVFEEVRRGGALVPQLWALEVANILSSGVKRGRLKQSDATRFLSLLADLPIEIVHLEQVKAASIASELFSLSQHHALTAYDSLYLGLALENDLPLASKDNNLNTAAKKAGIRLFT